jgi:hypothetical protein
MKTFIIFGLIFLIACNPNKRKDQYLSSVNNRKTSEIATQNDGDPSKLLILKRDSLQVLIKEANKRVKVPDSSAIELLLKVNEIREINNYNYHNPKIFNSLNIIGVPNDIEKRWEIDMGQFQEGIDKYYSFIRFWVEANTGSIEVLDLNFGVDDPIELNEWLKLKRDDKK